MTRLQFHSMLDCSTRRTTLIEYDPKKVVTICWRPTVSDCWWYCFLLAKWVIEVWTYGLFTGQSGIGRRSVRQVLLVRRALYQCSVQDGPTLDSLLSNLLSVTVQWAFWSWSHGSCSLVRWSLPSWSAPWNRALQVCIPALIKKQSTSSYALHPIWWSELTDGLE